MSWLVDHSCPWSPDTCAMAAKEGDHALLMWLHDNCFPWDERTCANAAEQGHVKILQWACANGCPSKRYSIDDSQGTA